MNPVLENIIKERVISRILKHSFIYSREELSNLSLRELKNLQNTLFVGLTIKINYLNRHK